MYDVTCDVDAIDDETFDQGDEHIRYITGGSNVCSVLSTDEAENKLLSIAPAEGQRPINMTDETFELICNLEQFPYGTGCFNPTRPTRITYRKYFQQRVLDVDGGFARDLDYLFTAQYIVESKQIFDDALHYIFRQKPASKLTASES